MDRLYADDDLAMREGGVRAERAEEPIPDQEAAAVVRLALRNLCGVMNRVQVRGHEYRADDRVADADIRVRNGRQDPAEIHPQKDLVAARTERAARELCQQDQHVGVDRVVPTALEHRERRERVMRL